MLPAKGRQGHTTTVVHCDPTHKRLIHFGGIDKEPKNPDQSTWDALAETMIVELGKRILEQLIHV